MCVIIWSPDGRIPKQHVLGAMLRHQDGWGFSVSTGKKIATYRSVDHEQFLAAWANRAAGPVLFHARWATHGAVVRENCHPFPVRGHKLSVAHNGIIRGYGSERRSDTRHFIEEVLEPMPEWFLEEDSIVQAIELVLGNSKMVFVRPDGEATILNEHLGVWQGGRWYSNRTAF